jgi:hypothetical protein
MSSGSQIGKTSFQAQKYVLFEMNGEAIRVLKAY